MNPLHASEMRAYQACPRMWQHAYLDRRVPVSKSEAISRGTEVHRYLEQWWLGRTIIPSDLPPDPIAQACCLGYSAHYGSLPAGRIDVELPFTCEVGGSDDTDGLHTYGVVCAGTVDALVCDVYGELTIYEHKTTSRDLGPGALYWREMT